MFLILDLLRKILNLMVCLQLNWDSTVLMNELNVFIDHKFKYEIEVSLYLNFNIF